MPIPFFAPALVGLDAVSADETKSAEIPLNNAVQIGGTVKWSTGCSAGQVIFEIAPVAAYAGAWEAVFTGDFINNGVESFTYPGPFSGFGRWRINTAVVGGTVSSDTQMLVGA